jgi:F420-dependent oxidoreductase-like protein
MIEGQEGVSWDEWLAVARACEEHGVETLFRSDHYLSRARPTEREALDAWTTLAALAQATERVRLGTLVSPVTFRHPSVLAKSAATVDQISGGRVEVGMGAGWMELEHSAYGFLFPETRVRMELLAEQVEIVHRQLTEERTSFTGKHYRLEDCPNLPRPVQQPRPPLIVGGTGLPGTARPAARFADEYNTLLVDVEEARQRKRRVSEMCEREGRDPATLRLSLMTGFLVGADETELTERARRLLARRGEDGDPAELVRRYDERGVAGTPEQVVGRLRALEDAGVDRVMLQHLLHDDLETVALVGREVAPAVA